MEAATCADAFVATWVARFGVPGQLTSDRGRQFTSSLWAHVCQQLGIQHSLTTAYHPQSNGMVERCHRQIKDSLRARLAGARWPEHLPWVLLGLRAAPKEESGISSAEVLFGVPLTLPGQFIAAAEPDVPQLLKQLRDVPVIATRAPSSPPPSEPPAALQHADLVYVRVDGSSPPLAPQYRGPYRVLSRGPKYFSLQIGDQPDTVSVDRLKPHLGSSPVQPAVPPRRGRPPAVRDNRSYAAVVAGGGPC